jgi:hypothetical protein
MLQKNQALKDNSSSHKKINKKRNCQDKLDESEGKHKSYETHGKSGSTILKKGDNTRGETAAHMDKRKPQKGIALLLVEAPI